MKIKKTIAALSLVLFTLMLSTALTACSPKQVAQAHIRNNFGSLAPCAERIVQRESRFQAGAISPGGGNIGLFQINKVHAPWIQRKYGYSWNSLTDPGKNAKVAKGLYDEAARMYGDGWQPWRLRRGSGCPA